MEFGWNEMAQIDVAPLLCPGIRGGHDSTEKQRRSSHQVLLVAEAKVDGEGGTTH